MLRAAWRWLGAPVSLPLWWVAAVALATIPLMAWAALEASHIGRAAALNLAWALSVLAVLSAVLGLLQREALARRSPDPDNEHATASFDEMRWQDDPWPPPHKLRTAWQTTRETVIRLSHGAKHAVVSQALAMVSLLYLACGLVAIGALIR